jgi:hypothetical protein
LIWGVEPTHGVDKPKHGDGMPNGKRSNTKVNLDVVSITANLSSEEKTFNFKTGEKRRGIWLSN